MMTFKLKAPTLQAIELTNALRQAPEIANMIGATSLSVDVKNASATFTVGKKDYTAAAGQVISLEGDVIAVADAADFYAKYESVV